MDGFLCCPEFLSQSEERELAAAIAALPFSEVRMHGVVAKRRVCHFGWRYDYNAARVAEGPPIPEFLLPVRERLAAFASVAPEDLREALVTEYPAGAGIGWHREAPMFGIVAAVSLLSACRMRFRRGETGSWEKVDVTLEPRSAYVISGEARSQWQHHIPATENLRFSVTFRTLRRQK